VAAPPEPPPPPTRPPLPPLAALASEERTPFCVPPPHAKSAMAQATVKAPDHLATRFSASM
jgi:hypothetical protein